MTYEATHAERPTNVHSPAVVVHAARISAERDVFQETCASLMAKHPNEAPYFVTWTEPAFRANQTGFISADTLIEALASFEEMMNRRPALPAFISLEDERASIILEWTYLSGVSDAV